MLLIHEVMFSECDLKTKTNNHHIKSYVQGFHRKERQAPPIGKNNYQTVATYIRRDIWVIAQPEMLTSNFLFRGFYPIL